MQGDIELLFTVEGGSDLSAGSGLEIKKQLDQLVDNINKDPFRLKFLADEASLKTLTAEITKIRDELKNISFGDNMLAGFKTISDIVNTIGSNGTSNFDRIRGSVSNLNRDLNQTRQTVSDVAKATAGIGTEKVSQIKELLRGNGVTDAKLIDRIANEFKNLNGQITEVRTNWREFGEYGSHVASVTINAIDAVGNSFSKTASYYLRAATEAEQAEGSAEMVWAHTTSGAAKVQVTVDNTVKKFEKLKRAISGYLSEAKRALSDADIVAPKDLFTGEFTATGEGATKYAAKLNSMQQEALKARDALQTLGVTTVQQEELDRLLAQSTSEWAVAQETATRKVASQDHAEYLSKVNTAISEFITLVKASERESEIVKPANFYGQWTTSPDAAASHQNEINLIHAKRAAIVELLNSEEASKLTESELTALYDKVSKALQDHTVALERNEAASQRRSNKQDEIDYYEELSAAIQRYNQLMSEAVKNKNVAGPDKGNALGTWTAGENATANDKLLVENLNAQAEAIRKITEAKQDDAKTTQAMSDLETRYKDTVEKTARAQEQRAAKSKEAQVVNEQAAKSLADYEKIARQYAKAGISRNADSREAYSKLQEAANKLNTAYAKGKGDTEAIKKAQEEYNRVLQESRAVFIRNGDDVKTMGDRIKDAARNLGIYISTAMLMRTAFRYFKQMVSNAIELDSAFAQLRIITHATDAEMAQFASTSATLAQNLGKSIIDVTKSIEVFSRLGYNLQDASKLAEYATILSNVADVDASAATTGLTSIIKGFNLNVEDASHVADVLVEVGQKYAVSAAEMMEAYEKSGAALNATNTSLEKSAGLIAAANASVQNASTVGEVLPMHAVMRV